MKIYYLCFLILFVACNDTVENKKTTTVTEIPTDKSMQDLIQKYPDSLILKENMIQYYRDSAEYDKAIELTSSYLKADSLNTKLWRIKGTLAAENDDTLLSIQCFENIINIQPSGNDLIWLAILYASTKNPNANVIADSLLTNKNAQFEKEAFYIKGYYLTRTNKKQASIAYFDKSIQSSYTFVEAYREKALALYDLKKYQQALDVLGKAITVQNNYDEAYYYSGLCLEQMNNKQLATEYYQNALIYNPNYELAELALNRLTK
jgi:tetratricopeptide (TPR) repeat protein